jgi:octaprenyl-diphosphate synthase
MLPALPRLERSAWLQSLAVVSLRALPRVQARRQVPALDRQHRRIHPRAKRKLTQMMVEGELLQLERIGKIAVTEADYMELIDRKTASLFSACAKLGAIVAGASEADEAQLGEYAWNLGIAFQLIDDILDFTSREKILGKPVGNDLREGKVTLPLIYALETADAEERKLIETILADGNYDQVPFGKILQILNKHHGIERAQERAREFTEKARSIISEFPNSPYQKALNAVTDLVTGRDH